MCGSLSLRETGTAWSHRNKFRHFSLELGTWFRPFDVFTLSNSIPLVLTPLSHHSSFTPLLPPPSPDPVPVSPKPFQAHLAMVRLNHSLSAAAEDKKVLSLAHLWLIVFHNGVRCLKANALEIPCFFFLISNVICSYFVCLCVNTVGPKVTAVHFNRCVQAWKCHVL